MTQVNDDAAAATLLRLAYGYQISRALHVAVELNVADHIGDTPVSAEDVAPRVGAHPGSLYRLLRALATVGVFRETDDQRFVASPMSDLLRTDHPRSLWAWPGFGGHRRHWQLWGDLLHCVRTGQDANRHLHGTDGGRPYRADKPEEAAAANAGFAAASRSVVPAVLAAYDFARFQKIVDVGGGNGTLLTSILGATPRATGIVFDLPHVAPAAAAVIRQAGLEGRCEARGGSYRDGVPPGGDAYIIKSVLMDQTAEEAAAVLRKVRAAMGARGTLLVIERLIGAPNEGQPNAMMDLTMLVATGGFVRRRDEWAAIFTGGGFTLDSVTPTASPFHILEGRPST
jgi:hypothetical protein